MATETTTAPAAPIVLAEVRSDALAQSVAWIERRGALLTQAAAIAAVDSQATFDLAGGLLADAKRHLAALEKRRKELTAPLDAIKRGLMDQERELGNALLAEITRIKRLADSYATAQAYAAEQARLKQEREQAEAQRKAEEEAERQRAELQAKADAEAAAKRAAAAAVFGDQAAAAMVPPADTVETPVVAVAPPAPPPPLAPKAEGARLVTRWAFRVVDPNAVPREYCSVDETKIRAWMQYQVKLGNPAPALPGVEFSKSVSTESR